MKLLLSLSKLLLASVLLSSCSGSEPSGKTIKFNIPVLQDAGFYALQTVEVPTPKSMASLESDFVNFSMGIPRARYNGEGGIDVTKKPLSFKFIKKGDVYYPTGDMYSLEAATSYYLMYKAKQRLDKLDYDFSSFWPQTVALNDPGADGANYFFPTKSLNVTRVNTGGKIAGAMNANVFYHELFHGMFYQILFDQFRKENPDKQSMYDFLEDYEISNSLKKTWSIGEGLADVFAITMSKNPSIFAHFSYGGDKIPYRNYDKSEITNLPFSKIYKKYGTTSKYHRNGEYFAIQFLRMALDQGKGKYTYSSLESADTIQVQNILIDFVKTKMYSQSSINAFSSDPELLQKKALFDYFDEKIIEEEITDDEEPVGKVEMEIE